MLKSLRIMEANGIALEQKDSGTATVAYMHRYEVEPEKLAEYQHLATAEAVRAVREDAGVMGMFVTAEHDNPNIIHTMELYRDKAAYEQYQQSAKAKEFQSKIGAMFIKAHTVENLPANITLSQKGLKKS
jgi:quinol monooxygenase YgiN